MHSARGLRHHRRKKVRIPRLLVFRGDVGKFGSDQVGQSAPIPVRAVRGIPWSAWVVAVGLVGGALGPYLHETDQASLLAGAWRLAHDPRLLLGADFYNYDKQFGAYWCVAAVLRLVPGAEPVWLANVTSFAAFWAALAGFLWRQPARSLTQAACVVAIVLAPTLLQHSAFLASNYFSGAWLLAGATLLSGRLAWSLPLAALCLGLGVATRADALFVLPALAWWRSTRRAPLALLRDPLPWIIAGVGVVAFGMGRALIGVAPKDIYALFFHPKIYLAFVVFGLGAVVFAATGWMVATLTAWRRARRARPFYLIGALTLLPALLYYSVQMFSTRHWTVWVVGLLVLVSGRRAAVLLGRLPRWAQTTLVVLCFSGAVGPLIIGVHLPNPLAARPVVGSGTRFPSADGNLTMGGYGFALRDVPRRAGLVDHNHAIWRAARDANYVAGPDGTVAFLDTPMAAYYRLALTLREKPLRLVSRPEAGAHVDSRSWLRPVARLDTHTVRDLAAGGWAPRPVSAEFSGVRMLRFETEGDVGAGEQRDASLKALFRGNEFMLLAENTDWNRREFEGRTLVWFAPQPFLLERSFAAGVAQSIPSAATGAFHCVVLKGEARRGTAIRWPASAAGEKPRVAASVLMDYMALDAFTTAQPGASGREPDGK